MKVELRNIHKTFGQVHANHGISLVIPPGTIQGILGENGAGKSTLMKILSGFIQADQGEILLDDQAVVIKKPSDAIKHGIGMLHQDPLDFPPMKIVDNLLIGSGKGLFPDRAKATSGLRNLGQQFGFDLDPDAYVDSLTVGERQQLEIIRLLWLGARVLILDEPTTGISSIQKEKLFAALKKLVAQGMTVIFVSHKLEDVESLCHQVAVFQRGKVVGEAKPPYDTRQLVTLMFGKPISLGQRQSAFQEDVALELKDVSIDDYRLKIENINLTVCKGEVIGLAGMEGSGQRQFLRTLGGLMRAVNGKIMLADQDITAKSYRYYMDQGVAYIPASRLEEGLIPGLNLTDHFILCGEQRGIFINRDAAVRVTEDRIADFSIRGTPNHRVESLSGGNQQRALLALMRTPLSLMLMEHPTRGLDVESAIWIWSKLKERCRQGTSIFFISADLEEILQYSDRILVFFGGKVSKPIPAASATVDQLGQLIGGKGL